MNKTESPESPVTEVTPGLDSEEAQRLRDAIPNRESDHYFVWDATARQWKHMTALEVTALEVKAAQKQAREADERLQAAIIAAAATGAGVNPEGIRIELPVSGMAFTASLPVEPAAGTVIPPLDDDGEYILRGHDMVMEWLTRFVFGPDTDARFVTEMGFTRGELEHAWKRLAVRVQRNARTLMTMKPQDKGSFLNECAEFALSLRALRLCSAAKGLHAIVLKFAHPDHANR